MDEKVQHRYMSWGACGVERQVDTCVHDNAQTHVVPKEGAAA